MLKLPPPSYGPHYSETALLVKLRAMARRSLRGLIEKALILYVLLAEPATPAWARAAIVAALGYLICPLVLIPDALPVIGLSDDLAVLTVLVGLLREYVTPQVRERARRMLDAL